jgi:predicted ArsR family transcriptional regulator
LTTVVEGPTLRVSRALLGIRETKVALLHLLLQGDRTVDSLATSTGIHRTVVRRHMLDLLGAGLVTADPLRGARGRPKTNYSLTSGGREVFFARYDVVLDCLTRGSVRRSGLRRTRTLFEEAGRTLAADLGFPASLDSVVRALQEVGFQPEIRKENGRRLVISHNCPVFQQAKKNPDLLCQSFHTRLLTEAREGGKAELRQTMARGATECVHALTSP